MKKYKEFIPLILLSCCPQNGCVKFKSCKIGVVIIDVTLCLLMLHSLRPPPFSLPSTVTSRGKEEDLLVYTLASPIVSPEPASVPAKVKPPVTQVYTRR